VRDNGNECLQVCSNNNQTKMRRGGVEHCLEYPGNCWWGPAGLRDNDDLIIHEICGDIRNWKQV
jgi:hypothetical protein